jgi:DeoR/GlpR family transcriptional regulator of sugar metabolism
VQLNSLLKEERQRLILEALQENKKVTVQELSQRFGTSEVTIRRDLQELASGGMLRRAHRGAILVTPAPPEPPVMHRMTLEQHAKDNIARCAAGMVSDGDSIFIGSGSTCAYLARHLAARKNLTVVTNALNIATDLALASDNITTVVTGGVVRAPELSILGHITELSLEELRVSRVFMGMQAISIEGGLTTDHLPEVATTRKIIDMASDLTVLADHTKLNRMAAAYIYPVIRMTHLITDNGADAEFLARLEELGIRVIIPED